MVDSTELSPTATKPRRRSYQTGESLPELTDSFRPIQLGRDSVGDPDSAVRAFAVGILNRSDNTVYVQEGDDGDEIAVERFESYDIWEPNGISRIQIRGEQGGEQVVIRTLEAHNDFDIGDKIDAFVRSISHFLQSSKSETVVTDTETTFDVAGDVSIQNDSVTVDGDVGIVTESDSAEITTEIADSNITQDIDITQASLGDLRVADRTAKTTVVTFRFKNQAVDSNGNPRILNAYLFNPSSFDGYVQNYTVRHYADPEQFTATGDGFPGLDLIGFAPELDEGDGFAPAVNRDYLSARQIRNFGRGSAEVEMLRYDSGHEIAYRIEPNQKIEFQSGDRLRFILGVFSMNDDFDGNQTYIPAGLSETDRWITEVTLTVGQRETSLDNQT